LQGTGRVVLGTLVREADVRFGVLEESRGDVGRGGDLLEVVVDKQALDLGAPRSQLMSCPSVRNFSLDIVRDLRVIGEDDE
jgi:hypothetical protein